MPTIFRRLSISDVLSIPQNGTNRRYGCLIQFEHAGTDVEEAVRQIILRFGDSPLAMSVITAAELVQGIVRGKEEHTRLVRQQFYDDVLGAFVVLPLTLAMAELAGKIHGQQAARGILIPFQDLLIGATALHHGDAVLTGNTRHLQLIPGLTVLSL